VQYPCKRLVNVQMASCKRLPQLHARHLSTNVYQDHVNPVSS